MTGRARYSNQVTFACGKVEACRRNPGGTAEDSFVPDVDGGIFVLEDASESIEGRGGDCFLASLTGTGVPPAEAGSPLRYDKSGADISVAPRLRSDNDNGAGDSLLLDDASYRGRKLRMGNRQYAVYILTNLHHTVLYTGVTNDLHRRVSEHKKKSGGAFTSKYNVNQLVYFAVSDNVEQAIFREKQIKAGSRQKKVDLINSLNPEWKDLFYELFEDSE